MKQKLINLAGYFFISILLVLVSLIFYDFVQGRFEPKRLAETKSRGNQIVSALENYKGKNDSYPKVLEELVPDYLDEIKQPVWGKKMWEYQQAREGQSFNLMVGEGKHNYPSLSHTRKGWYLDN